MSHGGRVAVGAEGRSGVLPVDKPPGPTSHDVVAAARRALRERRIGHTGTLDPFASGLLLLCVGPATRLAEYLSGASKRYRAVARLGEVTETDDPTGDVVARSDRWRTLAPAAVESALAAQVGTVLQRPPAYSAKKIEGRRAYRLAREGVAVEPAPVRVEIEALELVSLDLPELTFDVACSSGTYVRAIARDLGEALGTGAHLTALRRTAVSAFRVEDAIPLDALGDAAAVDGAWIEPLDALAGFPRVELSAVDAANVAHGRAVPAPAEPPPAGPVALAREGSLLAVAELTDGALQPRKVFVHG